MIELMGEPIGVGSHGFIGLVDVMGDDMAVVHAARVSYGAEEEDREESFDRHLLRYLMRHRHTTPTEQCEMKFIVQVPMDVWRQWIRHRTASVNEYSTRYTKAIDMRAITGSDQWRLQAASSKQGSDGFVLGDIGRALTDEEAMLHAHSQTVYEGRLAQGVAKEQARKDLPLSTYTRAYWKCDLHNIFHFLGLRLDPHAQLEIREFAQAMAYFVKLYFPWSYEAFEDYYLNAIRLSSMEVTAIGILIRNGLSGVSPTDDSLTQLGMSSREITEFRTKLIRIVEEE